MALCCFPCFRGSGQKKPGVRAVSVAAEIGTTATFTPFALWQEAPASNRGQPRAGPSRPGPSGVPPGQPHPLSPHPGLVCRGW